LVITNKSSVNEDSVSRIASILTCLSNGNDELADIAKSCNLPKSTAHRMLIKLSQSGLALRDKSTHKYYLGTLLTQLASKPQIAHQYLITHCNSEMMRLVDVAEETVILAIMVGIKYVRLHGIPSKYELKVNEEAGLPTPMFCGAGPKALLSQLNNNDLKQLISRVTLNAMTERSVVDKENLLKQVIQIRQQGYAISEGERIPGALGISCPIKHYTYPAVITIVGPDSRMKGKTRFYLQELQLSVNRISKIILESVNQNLSPE
jgi:IclR family transcriptional regulator, KDG regulon repressor